MFLLRGLTLITFAADLALTNWAEMIKGSPLFGAIPGLADLIIVSPFLAASVLVLLSTYPVDRAVRQYVTGSVASLQSPVPSVWGLRSYLGFNIRHQLLTVVIPMSVILIIYDLTQDYESAIVGATHIPWSADIALFLAAATVFVIAPWMLKHIWTTHPLPGGPLRSELEKSCKRIGLRCRDILIWRSGGMVVNAAVMGILPRLRYVVLSDGLVDSMDSKQIEAVFGHEAGHVRHKHIQFFLLFALASMLLASGVMETFFHLSAMPDTPLKLSNIAIQGIGLLTIGVLWAVGFGFVSQRFERQADLFGAQSVAPDRAEECALPCSVHSGETEATPPLSSLCATGAEIFAGALDQVALLNGIPRRERSWRHSSIASRVELLKSFSGDPNRVRSFERVIRLIKSTLLIICVVGLGVSTWYLWPYLVDAMSRSR